LWGGSESMLECGVTSCKFTYVGLEILLSGASSASCKFKYVGLEILLSAASSACKRTTHAFSKSTYGLLNN